MAFIGRFSVHESINDAQNDSPTDRQTEQGKKLVPDSLFGLSNCLTSSILLQKSEKDND